MKLNIISKKIIKINCILGPDFFIYYTLCTIFFFFFCHEPRERIINVIRNSGPMKEKIKGTKHDVLSVKKKKSFESRAIGRRTVVVYIIVGIEWVWLAVWMALLWKLNEAMLASGAAISAAISAGLCYTRTRENSILGFGYSLYAIDL